MKYLLLITGLLWLSNSFAQYSDTITCSSGPNDLTYAIHYDQQQCVDSCDGSYSIEILNGSGSYAYQVDGNLGSSFITSAEDSLCPEDFLVVVYDLGYGIACTAEFSVDTVQIVTHSIGLTHCSSTGVCDGEALLDIQGGVPPYNIVWYDATQTPIPNQSDLLLDSLCAGNYYYSFTDSSPGCCENCVPGFGPGVPLNLVPFTINEDLIVIVDWTMDEICPWMCDGMAQVTASGGTGNYTYDIGFQQNSNGMFTDLCPSSYTVSVFDDQGNMGFETFDIFPAMEPFVQISSTNESCEGSCDGSIYIQDLIGDLAQFSIDGGMTFQNDPTFTGLCPDFYDVWVMNFNGCTMPMSGVTIDAGSSPVINFITSTQATSPTANDGCITEVEVSGGNPTYMYTIDGQPLFLPSCGLAPGSYEICVTDLNGCSACETIVIDYVMCQLSVGATANSITCYGECDGSASLWVSGAQGGYTILWMDASGGFVGDSETITDLCPDDYSFIVIDGNGCEEQGTVTIDEADPVVATAIPTSSCSLPCNGTVVGYGAGGVGDYQYSLDGITWTPNNTFVGLCPDVYIMYVQDANGCLGIYTFVIDDQELVVSTNIVTEYSTETNCIGEIESSVSGGASPYTYVWYECNTQNVIETTENVTNLCPGEYFVQVTDMNGCMGESECDTIQDITLTNELNASNWSVYPNPANGNFTVRTNLSGDYVIEIFDLTGKSVVKLQTGDNAVTLNSDKLNLNVGVYLIQIEQGAIKTRKRIVIQ